MPYFMLHDQQWLQGDELSGPYIPTTSFPSVLNAFTNSLAPDARVSIIFRCAFDASHPFQLCIFHDGQTIDFAAAYQSMMDQLPGINMDRLWQLILRSSTADKISEEFATVLNVASPAHRINLLAAFFLKRICHIVNQQMTQQIIRREQSVFIAFIGLMLPTLGGLYPQLFSQYSDTSLQTLATHFSNENHNAQHYVSMIMIGFTQIIASFLAARFFLQSNLRRQAATLAGVAIVLFNVITQPSLFVFGVAASVAMLQTYLTHATTQRQLTIIGCYSKYIYNDAMRDDTEEIQKLKQQALSLSRAAEQGVSRNDALTIITIFATGTAWHRASTAGTASFPPLATACLAVALLSIMMMSLYTRDRTSRGLVTISKNTQTTRAHGSRSPTAPPQVSPREAGRAAAVQALR